jgi:polysaccharide export outer membrane protein
MGSLRATTALGFCGVAFLLSGCFFPTSGPSGADIRSERVLEPDGLQYALVRLNTDSAATLAQFDPRGFVGTFQDRRPAPEIKFGIGDVVSVTIFEAAAGGLFIPIEAGVRPGNFVTLPNQPVDTAGNISVPYAGAVQARGRTPSEVQTTIVERIRNRAIEPQAVVALVTQNTSLISVLGEVNIPSRFPINPAGERILDVVTRAGGIKGQGFESWITLERNGRRATAPFGALVYEPANNIWAWPNDQVYVYREPQVFLAFGATGQQGQFPFDKWRLSLAEGVAKAGGLLDAQADPGAVFLYRPEPRDVAEKLGVDISRFPGPLVPVIFAINLRDPGAYFIANSLYMRNKDVLFVSNAGAVETAKVLQFIRTVIATANDGTVFAVNTQILRKQ